MSNVISNLRFVRKLRQRRIADIEDFVRDRLDQQAPLHLPSLQQLSDADLEWLAAAIDNC